MRLSITRRTPIGAEVCEGSETHFRVWAPERKSVRVVSENEFTPAPLDREPGGYFSGLVRGATTGMRYKFELDGGEEIGRAHV